MKVECRGLFRLSGQRKEWEGVRGRGNERIETWGIHWEKFLVVGSR